MATDPDDDTATGGPRRDPPATECRPVTETLHGTDIEDPYRWLEADDDADVEAWIEAQNEYTDAHVENATRESLRPAYEELATVVDYGPVLARGGRRFQRIEGPEEDHPVLYLRTDDGLRTLVDPNEWEGASMGWYLPSPDGDLVAYGRAAGGTEQYDVHVIDLDGEQVDVVADAGRVSPGMFAWTDAGFYYMCSGSAEAGAQLDKEIRFRGLPDEPRGGEDSTDPAAGDRDYRLDFEMGERAWPILETAGDGTLVIALDEMSIRTDLYVLGPDDDRPRPVLTGVDATFYPTAEAGRLYLRTTYDAPLGRVLSVPVEQLAGLDAGAELDPDGLDVAVPEDDSAVLRTVAVADGTLVAHHHRDAASELSVWNPQTGTRQRTVDLPEYTTVMGLDADGDGDRSAAYYLAQSFDRPVSVVRLDPATGERTVVDEQDVEVGADIAVDREWFESADGTEVPAYVVRRADVAADGTAPAVVYGYGGFRNNLTPNFRRFRLPFLRDGGVYVQAVLRGGAEFGEQWHRAGMREDKQNVFDDFYAVAEGVVERGYADGDRVAAAGGSNGGLLVGAAITQRPERWAGAYAAVPLMDMLRFHRFLLGEAWTNEYGSPEDPEAFEYLRAYSPYHNVDESGETVYPPTLIRTAAGDTRVHPAHARKMTARLQAAVEAAGDGGPVCFRSVSETGHGVGTPTEVVVRQRLDQWTFLYDHLGLDHEADVDG